MGKWRGGSLEGRTKPSDEYRTPDEFFAMVDREFSFAFDAACNSGNCRAPRGAKTDEGLDGLLVPWLSPTWCNPPYSNVLPWIKKAIHERDVRGVTSCLLVPADTSVGWWWRHVPHEAHEVRFTQGRLRFVCENGRPHTTKKGGGTYPGPTALVVFSPESRDATHKYIPRKETANEELLKEETA